MTRRWLACVLLACFVAPASAAFSVEQLMRDLARHKGGKALFVEKRFLAILDKPVVSSGEMIFTPPDRLERRTFTPRPELLLLEGDRLTIERDRRRFSIDLAQQPQAKVFVDSLRRMLLGDLAALQKDYGLYLSGTPDKWQLSLLPGSGIADLLSRISVRGSGNQIRGIEYVQVDGDRVELTIEPTGDR